MPAASPPPLVRDRFGGRLRNGEELEDAVRRIAREELGLDIAILRGRPRSYTGRQNG